MTAEAEPLDLVIVGAGPCGLAAAVAAKESRLRNVVLDRGCITESLTHYPYYMTFFSTAERLEIGGVPFTIPEAKPTRRAAGPPPLHRRGGDPAAARGAGVLPPCGGAPWAEGAAV